MFIGRKKELDILQSLYLKEMHAVVCVTGSAGMGKTAMLQHFAEGKNSIYFCCYETTGQQELKLFSQTLGISDVTTPEGILEEITKRAKKEKLILILDQYPNLSKADPKFNALIHRYATQTWKNLPIMLILCGDAFLLMDKYVYGKKALWKNDIDEHICLQALSFAETRDFFPDASPEQSALYYGISGGMPPHLIKMQGMEIKEAAKRIFCGESGKAAFLPEQILGSELRELSYYNCILSAMAQGMNRVNQLSAEVEKPKDVVVPYLNALMSIGIVTKQTAITEETNRKKTRYSIVNSNVVFWYRYIVPHMDLYTTGQWDLLWDNYIAPELDSFMQQIFIRISREYLEEKARAGHMPFTIERSGNWWTNDDETGETEGFDIVSLGSANGKDATIFTLCFYEERAIAVAELKKMIDRTKLLKREGEAFYVVCAKDKFHENVETAASTIKNILLITLNDEAM